MLATYTYAMNPNKNKLNKLRNLTADRIIKVTPQNYIVFRIKSTRYDVNILIVNCIKIYR